MDPAGLQRTIRQLEDLGRRPIVPAREAEQRRINFLLERLGNPHTAFRSVHAAGSTGKGSTTTMIGSVLQAAGFRTGYFRSPHLWSYTERIAVDSVDIADSAWVSAFDTVWPLALAMADGEVRGYRWGRPSLSEIWFAMACLHFRERGVHWAAVETGLGGRLDATNALCSDAAVITNISLEHTQILGSTVEAIAAEKAAIIKPQSLAVTGVSDPAALAVVREYADQAGAELIEVPRDVQGRSQHADLCSQMVDLRGPAKQHKLSVCLPLGGGFQATNAAVAAACVWGLRARGIPISNDQLRVGLESARVPGRFEVLQGNPTIIVDGAHAPAAAEELRRSLDELLADEPVILLFAAMADKDVERMARTLGPRAETVVVTSAPGTERGCPLPRLRAAFEAVSGNVLDIADVASALSTAQGLAEGKVLVVCGSLYLVGWVRHAMLRAEVVQ